MQFSFKRASSSLHYQPTAHVQLLAQLDFYTLKLYYRVNDCPEINKLVGFDY